MKTLLRAPITAPSPDGHARRNKDIGGDPDLVADGDRFGDDGKIRPAMVMGRGAEIGALRDHAVGADLDGTQAVELGMVADPGAVTNRKAFQG